MRNFSKLFFFVRIRSFGRKFVKKNKENVEMKAILPIASAPCNLNDTELKSRKIGMIFLPSNYRSIWQPADDGIIETTNKNTGVAIFSY
jgi:hypothetical protein